MTTFNERYLMGLYYVYGYNDGNTSGYAAGKPERFAAYYACAAAPDNGFQPSVQTALYQYQDAVGYGGKDDPALKPRDNGLTPMQEATLRRLCEGYRVPFDASHYWHPSDLPDGWVQGFIGGTQLDKSTICVGVSPEGEAHS